MHIRIILPLLLACSCSKEAQDKYTEAAQHRTFEVYTMGITCIRAGETYRSCDHMCYNAVDDMEEFRTCIAGARSELDRKATRQ